MDSVAERVANDLVGHHSGMPRLGQADQPFAPACGLVNTLPDITQAHPFCTAPRMLRTTVTSLRESLLGPTRSSVAGSLLAHGGVRGLASIDGSIAIDGLPEAEAEASFSQLLENLDWAAASFVSARKGPWLVLGDFSYAALAVEDTVAGSTVEIDSDTSWISLAGGYTWTNDAGGTLDLFAGARYMAVKNDAKSSGVITSSSGKNEDWLDPLVGVQVRSQVAESIDLGLLVDFAGFGVGSDLTYEILPSMSWRFSKTLALHFGYRWMDTDFEDSDFAYDVTQAGWILGLGIAF